MKKNFSSLPLYIFLAATSIVLLSFNSTRSYTGYSAFTFPYKSAGLSDREAAAHLLNRFSFGATQGLVDEVVQSTPEKWFAEQLNADYKDDQVDSRLSSYASLKMTTEEIVHTYPKPGQVLRQAMKTGDLNKDSVRNGDKKDYKDEVKNYMNVNGLRPQAELFRELINQKIVRAAYSKNQLKEILTDFWFNHFNVSLTKGDVRQFVTSYERDAIRPNVLGKFEDLLLATAKSPAMLTYLDNFKSTVNQEETTKGQKMIAAKREEMRDTTAKGKIKKPKMQGLNENYAREITELHTLGVDGGYTQSDVTQAARVLTGWTVNPEIEFNVKANKKVNEQRLKKMG
ncbi:MAG: DUF1800 family protein, partial [Flavisolibacter sp.]